MRSTLHSVIFLFLLAVNVSCSINYSITDLNVKSSTSSGGEVITTPSIQPPTTPGINSQFQILKNINTSGTGSNPYGFVVTSIGVFYSASDESHGSELWVTDGTSTGSRMLVDLNPQGDSDPKEFTELNGYVYFKASDETHWGDLFKTDGTAAGTSYVFSPNPSQSGNVRYLKVFNQELYFVSIDGNTLVYSLWKINKVTQVAEKLKDFTWVDNLFVFSGSLYFEGNDGTTGQELWKTDGTIAGTQIVKDINPGANWSYPGSFTVLGSYLYFSAEDGTNVEDLFRTDGTSAGTSLVKQINTSGSSAIRAIKTNGTNLLFPAATSTNGLELWTSNGTLAGTQMVKDINPGGGDGVDVINNFNTSSCFIGATLYFIGNDGISGSELWKSDGTTAGTQLVKDINPGANGSGIRNCITVGAKIFFFADDGVHGLELWVSDGSTVGTSLVKDIKSGIADGAVVINFAVNIFEYNNKLLFVADDGIYGPELWTSDGTQIGTSMLKDANLSNQGSNCGGAKGVYLGSNYYFTANDGFSGCELWKTDGTANGTVLVKDISPGSGSSYPYELNILNGKIIFVADDNIHGRELWISDGTAAGTNIIIDLKPGVGSGIWASSNMVYFNNYMYFSGNIDPIWGLYKTDGTSAGTSLVKEIESGWYIRVTNLTVVGSTLYFVPDASTSGSELWKSDGTPGGTVMVKDINSGAASSINVNSADLTVLNGILYFSADDGVNGKSLWRSDGSSAGTQMVKKIQMGNSSNKSLMLSFSNRLFFFANDGVSGIELWQSDGTSGGTILTKDINPGVNGSQGSNLVATIDKLFFTADSGNGDSQLWTSDGSTAGTHLVKDINATGNDDSYDFYSYGSNLFFGGFDNDHNYQIWYSDGTSSGTTMVQGPTNSISWSPSIRGVIDNKLLINADDGLTGYEIYILPLQ